MKTILVEFAHCKDLFESLESAANSMNLRLVIIYPLPKQYSSADLVEFYTGNFRGAHSQGYDILVIANSYISSGLLSREESISVHKVISLKSSIVYCVCNEDLDIPIEYSNVIKIPLFRCEESKSIINKKMFT